MLPLKLAVVSLLTQHAFNQHLCSCFVEYPITYTFQLALIIQNRLGPQEYFLSFFLVKSCIDLLRSLPLSQVGNIGLVVHFSMQVLLQ